MKFCKELVAFITFAHFSTTNTIAIVNNKNTKNILCSKMDLYQYYLINQKKNFHS